MKKISISGMCILLGSCVICYAGYLFVENQQIEMKARKNSAIIVEKLLVVMDTDSDESDRLEQADETSEYNIEVEDNLYSGILTIPKLELTLPIQTEWSYSNLKDSPCIYQEIPFSIAAHNYQAHFGQLIDLEIGDEAIYTKVSGIETVYQVVEITQIAETEVAQLEVMIYDMTLFTCDYNDNNKRILVRFNEKL
ncbi:MAG: sortase [Eubacteriales bacterium]